MAEADQLTLAFLTAHPVQAARVLERLPAAEAAALFARVPARAAAPALAAMLPPASAQVIGALEDQPAMALLTAAGPQATVGVLRHVADPRRTRLIESLPTATALASRLLLGYPEDSVGAWVDPAVVALGPDASAGSALTRVRANDAIGITQIYVVESDQRLLGVVDLQGLLRAPETATLGTLMRPAPPLLSAVAPVTSAPTHPGWQEAAEVPVVERGDRLIGVLRQAVLARALTRNMIAPPSPDEVTVTGLLARGYWDAVSGLAEAALVLLPRVKPVLPEKK